MIAARTRCMKLQCKQLAHLRAAVLRRGHGDWGDDLVSEVGANAITHVE